MSKEAEAYLLSRGLRNALFSINAVDLTEDLFGTLVPCPFQVVNIWSTSLVGEFNVQLPHVIEPDIMLFHRVLESQPGVSDCFWIY